MMSLYLKALEGERSQLPPKQSLLPELKYNIICGNSLIGPDVYDQGPCLATRSATASTRSIGKPHFRKP